MADSLNRLVLLLEDVFSKTLQTKFALQACCDQTRSVLSKWPLPEPLEDSDLPRCTCVEDPYHNEHELEDFAVGIGELVENAQKLRERFLERSKDPSRKPRGLSKSQERTKRTVENNSEETSKSRNKPSVSESIDVKKNPPSLNKIGPRFVPAQLTKPSARNLPFTRHADRTSFRVSKTSMQTTYQKDFTLQKRLQHTVKIASKDQANGEQLKVNSRSTDTETSPRDLNELLDNISIGLYTNSGNTKPTVSVNPQPCLLHDVPRNSVNRKCKTRDAPFAEALDIVGVPPDLVKMSRSFHHYTVCHKPAKRGQMVAKGFLSNLNNRLTKEKETVTRDNRLFTLFTQYLHHFAGFYNTDPSTLQDWCRDMQEEANSLETTFLKVSNLEQSFVVDAVTPCPVKTEEHSDTKLVHMVNGVWNAECISGLLQKQCASYSSIEQWTSFQKNVQEIQDLDFQVQILNIIGSEVIPHLSKSTDKSSVIPLLKVAFALTDMETCTEPVILAR